MGFQLKKGLSGVVSWWNVDVKRFAWDVRNLFNPYQFNPYHPAKMRTAAEDITHAFVNLPVEWLRKTAYLMGHVYVFLFALACLAAIWFIGGLKYGYYV